MGNGTNSDIVTNSVRVGSLKERLDPTQLEEYADTGKLILNGWSLDPEVWKVAGMSGRLYADVLTKGGYEVLLVNTSVYASVGEEEFVVFGDERFVRAFCSDIGLTEYRLTPVDSICQTL